MQHQQDSGKDSNVYDFIFKNRWEHRRYDEHGMTWEEIVLAFIAQGGNIEAMDKHRFKRSTMSSAVAEMRKRIIKLVSYRCNANIVPLFKASGVKGYPLEGLNIHTKMTTINLVLKLEHHVKQLVQASLLRHAHQLTKRQVKSLDQDAEVKLKVAHWVSSRRYAWHHVAKEVWSMNNESIIKASNSDSGKSRPTEFKLTCPTCEKESDQAQRMLWSKARCKWLSVLCKGCKTKRIANQWKCECGVLWANCSAHRNIGMMCCNLTKAKAAANKAIMKKQQEGERTLTAQAKKRRRNAEKVTEESSSKGYRKRKAETELERKTRRSEKQEARQRLTETFKGTCFMLVPRGNRAQGAQEAINTRLQQMGSKENIEIDVLPTTVESMEWRNEVQAKIEVCQVRLHIIPVSFTEPEQGLMHGEAYCIGNQRDDCVTLVEWRDGGRVLSHDSLCIQRKRMEAHPLDERAEMRKQQRKETHLQQHIRKRKIAQAESIAKRRKLFTLVDGKIVKIDSAMQKETEGKVSHQSALCEQGSGEGCGDTETNPNRPPRNGCQIQEDQRHEEWFEQQCIQDDDTDPLGLGFELE